MQPTGLWLAGPSPGSRQALPHWPPHQSHAMPRPHAHLSVQPSIKGRHPNAFLRGLERVCPTKNHRFERHLFTSRPRRAWTQNSAPHQGMPGAGSRVRPGHPRVQGDSRRGPRAAASLVRPSHHNPEGLDARQALRDLLPHSGRAPGKPYCRLLKPEGPLTTLGHV